MTKRSVPELDEIMTALSPYEAAQEVEPWFLPDDTAEDDLPAGPHRKRDSLFDPAEWLAAQGALSGDLAAACLAFGRLDARLADAAEGMRLRLALQEISDLGWLTGARFGLERLSLFVSLRIGGDDEAALLGQCAWGVRRLTGPARPDGQAGGDWAAGLAGFLGIKGEAVLDLAATMEGTEALHPLTQAGLLFHAWKMAGAERIARDIEGGVMAARHAGCLGRGALFLPLALGSGSALRGQGTVSARLAAFYRGAEQASLAALMQVTRLAEWERRSIQTLHDCSGRTPRDLVPVFARWPLVSAPMAEAETGASRAAVQRNLDLMTRRGLIREITGQGRYRVWTAMV